MESKNRFELVEQPFANRLKSFFKLSLIAIGILVCIIFILAIFIGFSRRDDVCTSSACIAAGKCVKKKKMDWILL